MTTPTKTGTPMSAERRQRISEGIAARRTRVNLFLGQRMEMERRLCPDLSALPMVPYRRP